MKNLFKSPFTCTALTVLALVASAPSASALALPWLECLYPPGTERNVCIWDTIILPDGW